MKDLYKDLEILDLIDTDEYLKDDTESLSIDNVIEDHLSKYDEKEIDKNVIARVVNDIGWKYRNTALIDNLELMKDKELSNYVEKEAKVLC